LIDTTPEELLRIQSPPMADFVEGYLSMKQHVLVRFGKWREIIAQELPKDPDLYCSTTAMTLYAKGVAHSVLGEIEQADFAIPEGEAEPVVFRAAVEGGQTEGVEDLEQSRRTAVVVEAADTATSGDRWEVLGTRLVTQFSNNIRNNAGFMNRCEDTDPDARDKTFRQEGRKVFKEVVPMAAAHIEQHLGALEIAPADVRRYWLHQANLGMNQLVIKKLVGGEAGSERAPLVLDRYANTASAGSIIAFHEYHADMAAGDLGVICSFGAGYSIGSVVLRRA
jgi:hypothetical protein